MRNHQHINVSVRVRPLDVDPSVTKDPTETDNVMLIDDRHIGFIPNLTEKIVHANNLRRLQSSMLKDTAKDNAYNQIRSQSAGLGRGRSQSPRSTVIKRGASLNWPTFVYDHCFGPRDCFEAYERTFGREEQSLPRHRHNSTQEDVFKMIGRPSVETVMNGYHCCILAYGQTGSGKTYSMLGPCTVEGGLGGVVHGHASNSKRSGTPSRAEPSFIGFTKRPSVHSAARDEVSQIHSLKAHPQRGLIVRIMEALLEEMCMRSASDDTFCYEMSCSYYQIYREKAWDLLIERDNTNSRGYYVGNRNVLTDPLRLRMNERLDPYLEGLTEKPIRSVDQMLAVLDLGIRNRRVASTQHNVQSSRSHAILTINLAFGTPKETFRSRLYLVDLAGSERIGSLISGDRERTGSTSAVLLSSRNRGAGSRQLLKPDEQQWQEAAAAQIAEASDINSSLSALGKVIHVLSEMKLNASSSTYKHAHIPYRDSLLTMVLKNCFGGNAKTYMLATVSPYMRDAEESLSTLRFCSRAKLIINRPVKNSHKARLVEIEGLRTENAQLRRHVEELEEMLRQSNAATPLPQSQGNGSTHHREVSPFDTGFRTHADDNNNMNTNDQTMSRPGGHGSRINRSAVSAGEHTDFPTAPTRQSSGRNTNASSNSPNDAHRGGVDADARFHHTPQRWFDHDHAHTPIDEGDYFRARRMLADQLEVSELMLARMSDEEDRIMKMVRQKPDVRRGDRYASSRQNFRHHVDPVDDVVECPDGLEDFAAEAREDVSLASSIKAMQSQKSYMLNRSAHSNSIVIPTAFGLAQPPTSLSSPHCMNSTMPPQNAAPYHQVLNNRPRQHRTLIAADCGLVSSRATTPVNARASALLHSSSPLSSFPSPVAVETSSNSQSDTMGLEQKKHGRKKDEKKAVREKKEKKSRKKRQSISSYSSSDTSSDDEEVKRETEMMRTLVAQLTAMSKSSTPATEAEMRLLAAARALSPSARNPGYFNTSETRTSTMLASTDSVAPTEMSVASGTVRVAGLMRVAECPRVRIQKPTSQQLRKW